MTLEALIPLKARTGIAALTFAAVMMPLPAAADPFFFSTGNPDGLIGTAARPMWENKRSKPVMISFSLTDIHHPGDLHRLGSIGSDGHTMLSSKYIEFFPTDSDAGRTAGTNLFDSPVPTRANSPADVE